MEKGVHIVELVVAILVLSGSMVAAWLNANLRINTNRERVRAMEIRLDDVDADLKKKADTNIVETLKSDLLRELGGKIDYLTRMMEALAKKNGLDS